MPLGSYNAKKLQDTITRLAGRMKDKAELARLIRSYRAQSGPPLSPLGTETMKQLFGEADLSSDIARALETGLTSLEEWLGNWDDLAVPQGVPGAAAAPSPGNPGASGGSSAPAAGSGGSRRDAPVPLPGFADASLDEMGDFLWAFLLGGTALLVLYSLVALVRGHTRQARARPIREVWPPPTLTAEFPNAETLFEAYRSAMRFALQRRLDGLSHVEIEAMAVERHPAVREPLRRFNGVFETVYYDPAGGRDPGRHPDAASAYRKMIEGLRAL
jgi:hypothetical protein